MPSDAGAAEIVDRALIAQMQAEQIIAQRTIANLEIALDSARRIGAAIGIIMNGRKITEDQAFIVLSQTSQNAHRKLRDVADDVVLTGTID